VTEGIMNAEGMLHCMGQFLHQEKFNVTLSILLTTCY